jgi:hypothetical protein
MAAREGEFLPPAVAMTTDDRWNQEQAWAEGPAEPAASSWTDPGEPDWAEDVHTGAAWQVQGFTPRPQQSGLGIASLVLSLIAGVMIGIPLVFAVALVAQNPNLAEDDPTAIGLGCTMLVGVLLALLAGLLGLIGLFQPDRSRLCAILGVLFAGIEVFGIAGLFVLGLLVG